MKLEIEPRRLTLAHPLTSSYGTIRERELLLVALTDADGRSGYGEAAPLAPYSGVTLQAVRDALERCRDALAGSRHASGAEVIAACRSVAPEPQALAAIDMALWDLAGRREGRPVAELLCERPAAAVSVNATLTATDSAAAAEQAAAAARDGFGCVKVKVGLGADREGVAGDRERLAAVRSAVGPGMALRIDANGAWDVEQAIAAIDSLAPAGLELVEEPVHGVAAIRAVRARVQAHVAIDETAAEPGALSSACADAVCLKVSRCGGISQLLAAATLVRASGGEVYLASTLDGPLGIAAGVHAAAALASQRPLAPCGLATLELFEAPGDSLRAHGGAIALPRAPGLGVEPF